MSTAPVLKGFVSTTCPRGTGQERKDRTARNTTQRKKKEKYRNFYSVTTNITQKELKREKLAEKFPFSADW